MEVQQEEQMEYNDDAGDDQFVRMTTCSQHQQLRLQTNDITTHFNNKQGDLTLCHLSPHHSLE